MENRENRENDDEEEYFPDQYDFMARAEREGPTVPGERRFLVEPANEDLIRNIMHLINLFPLPWAIAVQTGSKVLGLADANGNFLPIGVATQHGTLLAAITAAVNDFAPFIEMSAATRENLDTGDERMRRRVAAFARVYSASGLLPRSRGIVEALALFLREHPEFQSAFDVDAYDLDQPSPPRTPPQVFSDVLDLLDERGASA